jgi:HEAT repeat protein
MATVQTGTLFIVLVLTTPGATATAAVFGRTGAQEPDARTDHAALARRLASSDSLTRREAAEGLAKLAAVDQLKIVQGYYLQEKDKRVRLALDWALYRMGQSEALYRVVRELTTSRHIQAASYLSQLEGPTPLYPFLKDEDAAPKLLTRLLGVLGSLGDGDTLPVILPFEKHWDSDVSQTAVQARERIEIRIANAEPDSSRPRAVGKVDRQSP